MPGMSQVFSKYFLLLYKLFIVVITVFYTLGQKLQQIQRWITLSYLYPQGTFGDMMTNKRIYVIRKQSKEREITSDEDGRKENSFYISSFIFNK